MESNYTKSLLKSAPTPKNEDSCALGHFRGIYRPQMLPEDETGPRVKNRRVAPLPCRRNAAIAAFPRQYQGPRSLGLVCGFASLWRPSRYTQNQLFPSRFASNTRKGLGSMHHLETPLLGLQ